jgi:hypothetical protein
MESMDDVVLETRMLGSAVGREPTEGARVLAGVKDEFEDEWLRQYIAPMDVTVVGTVVGLGQLDHWLENRHNEFDEIVYRDVFRLTRSSQKFVEMRDKITARGKRLILLHD